ncbi:DUF3850 domain-containing protein [Clostridium beijerinckii]|uniref:DUF3850 domain-containing protein n=1 Tax=Clostridium beijerinckii TaxID=1520 RepID=UPI001F25B33D|nr:DUF3850 domain-containing protein [Clostridium beijerinckii]
MKEIKKKIDPKYFKEVAEGKKDFEIRKDDSDYEVGDTLILQEINKTPLGEYFTKEQYTGNEIIKRIKYKITHEEFPQGIQEGYCILGLEPIGTENILDKLLKEGLDSKTIQECYERYRWHIDYYKDAIKLKNIDLTGISKLEQNRKIGEEQQEFIYAFEDYRKNPTKENKEHAIEEWWDRNQAELGLLDKEGISANDIMKEYPKHLEKLKSRPRHKEE